MICFKKIWEGAVLGNQLFWRTEVESRPSPLATAGHGRAELMSSVGVTQNLKGIGEAPL